MRMSVKGQSVLQKRAAAGSILRLAGAWGASAIQQAKASFGPKMPSLQRIISKEIERIMHCNMLKYLSAPPTQWLPQAFE